jgi:hypothetical protein
MLEYKIDGLVFMVYSHPGHFDVQDKKNSSDQNNNNDDDDEQENTVGSIKKKRKKKKGGGGVWGRLLSAMRAHCHHPMKGGGHLTLRGIDIHCISDDGSESGQKSNHSQNNTQVMVNPLPSRLSIFFGRRLSPLSEAAEEDMAAAAEQQEESQSEIIKSVAVSSSRMEVNKVEQDNNVKKDQVVEEEKEDLSALHDLMVQSECRFAADDAIGCLASEGLLADEKLLNTARVAIVDLGNACWTHKHFSDDIQTRQYRCPEVILGADYDTAADMWSLACIVFELLTGDLLFDPRAGDGYERDEDHLAQCIELLGEFPKSVSGTGKHARNYFNRKGELKHIQNLRFWPLKDVLHEKYRLPKEDSDNVAAFLVPLLNTSPTKRTTAWECLKYEWLTSVDS